VYQGLIHTTIAVFVALLHAHAFAEGKLISRAVQKELALPESQIDIGIAALTIAKEAYPGLDIKTYSVKLDELAGKARWLAKGTPDPETRIRVLNTVLFRHEGFRYDHEGFAQGGRKEHYYLNGILDAKKGNCFTMPLLYVAVAQRLGWPIYPVTTPSHLFARYADPAFTRQNIETTSGGKYFEDEWYIKDFSIGPSALNARSYLRTLTYKEYLGHILYAGAYAFTKDGHKVLAYTEKAAALDPRDPTFYQSLGDGYLAKSKITNGKLGEEFREKSRKATAKAKQLGYVDEESIKIGRLTRGQLR